VPIDEDAERDRRAARNRDWAKARAGGQGGAHALAPPLSKPNASATASRRPQVRHSPPCVVNEKKAAPRRRAPLGLLSNRSPVYRAEGPRPFQGVRALAGSSSRLTTPAVPGRQTYADKLPFRSVTASFDSTGTLQICQHMLRTAPPSRHLRSLIPTAADRPPYGPGWAHEIKHDGFRLIVRRDSAGLI
jgi:hypothetical protein